MFLWRIDELDPRSQQEEKSIVSSMIFLKLLPNIAWSLFVCILTKSIQIEYRFNLITTPSHAIRDWRIPSNILVHQRKRIWLKF